MKPKWGDYVLVFLLVVLVVTLIAGVGGHLIGKSLSEKLGEFNHSHEIGREQLRAQWEEERIKRASVTPTPVKFEMFCAGPFRVNLGVRVGMGSGDEFSVPIDIFFRKGNCPPIRKGK